MDSRAQVEQEMNMSSVAQFPMPQPPPRARVRTDEDLAISLLEGIVADMRTQAKFLIKCLNNHREIDREMWLELADVAAGVLGGTENVLCVSCLSGQKVKLGRGQGFDAVLCAGCAAEMSERVQ